MKREALVPIDDELFALIGEQKQRVPQRFLAGALLLFPRQNGNLNGRRPVSSRTYRGALYRRLEDCDIRDEHGQPVHLTPHQWRHTLVISPAFSARGTAKSGACRIVPHKYSVLREARATRPVPGSFSLRCCF
jgi:integrase